MKRWTLMLTVLCLFVCAVCFAAEGDSEIGKTIDWIWMTLFKALAVVISGLVMKALSKLARKYNIELGEKREALATEAALKAIGYAEEWARKRVKIDKLKVKSEEKFDKAVKVLADKIPMLTEDMARELVVSSLPRFRAMGDERLAALLKGKG